MIGVLSKPADQIDISDIKSLIDSEVPEGEQIEFKENLSTKGGSDDPWNTGKNKIGEQAKDALLLRRLRHPDSDMWCSPVLSKSPRRVELDHAP